MLAPARLNISSGSSLEFPIKLALEVGSAWQNGAKVGRRLRLSWWRESYVSKHVDMHNMYNMHIANSLLCWQGLEQRKEHVCLDAVVTKYRRVPHTYGSTVAFASQINKFATSMQSHSPV
eukprot:362480-Chlamydomonas_euryale.AAC.5